MAGISVLYEVVRYTLITMFIFFYTSFILNKRYRICYLIIIFIFKMRIELKKYNLKSLKFTGGIIIFYLQLYFR